MKTGSQRRSTAVRSAQKGVALIVALVLLVVMTLLGLSAMRTVTLEEKMSGHTFDRSISFQATEAALREAEAWVQANQPTPAAGSGCNGNGVCGLLTSDPIDRWNNAAFTDWRDAAAVTSQSISVTPQFLIEYLGDTFPCIPTDLTQPSTCKRYRITARSNAGAGRASVMLQSMYATE